MAFPLLPGRSTVEIGVKTGDWVRYDVICIGEPFLWNSPLLYYDPVEVNWVKAEVLSISGSNITVRQTIYCFDGRERNSTFVIPLLDLTKTMRSFGDVGYIIPANYDLGDIVGFAHIWLTDGNWLDVPLRLNDTVSRSYGGVIKEANVVRWSHLYPYFEYIYNFSYEICWDKSTGFLLEKTVQAYALGYENISVSAVKLKIEDTSMWVMETTQSSWSQQWPWAVVGLVGTTATGVTLIARMPKKKKQNESE
jgi:hypothetical protein